VSILFAALIICACLLGICWAFGGFDQPEGEWVWEWEQEKAIPTGRWIDTSGMKGTGELFHINPDNVKLGDR
jgi:hypothetical protein